MRTGSPISWLWILPMALVLDLLLPNMMPHRIFYSGLFAYILRSAVNTTIWFLGSRNDLTIGQRRVFRTQRRLGRLKRG